MVSALVGSVAVEVAGVVVEEVDSHLLEVDTGRDGSVRIPGGYLAEVPADERDELLCHR